ncbi:ribosomal subunit interface protein [Candidatus Kaiserbacteria bacterium RIFCSPLOWO2_01_FULL_53_17]|uniref:Ribosomal subunit interface protein n=1 Tax=Candidatus Kaiserbacteria bacterium RIFCSPLOWO2_01_FULL_53_17 TaxID=1798511 RepID=A0A1F6EGL5_9BACT|nr:MAG: ribosomal subunit interface protein [Candidatus Kaiserbacteria bacterium RIFCSPLOWO2_01_FULL_53_17]
MKINIKATHMAVTPAVRERIERICARLEKLANNPDPDALQSDIEVAKVTRHHRKGNVYSAEINFTAAGKYFRAVAEGETAVAALDEAHDEIKHELVHWKHKTQSTVRREGARFKRRGRAAE